MTTPLKVTVTGAAGQIAYSLLFRIAKGDVFGPKQPVILQMLEITPAMGALEGVAMELQDCAFPLLQGMVLADDAKVGFGGANWAFLVGAFPRNAGMDRSDLIGKNASIFSEQGKAINGYAASDIRLLVVGNPANTNALIAMSNAPDVPRERFTAMTRLDHNRALSMLATKAGANVADVRQLTVWGNHSNTMVPDLTYCHIGRQKALNAVGKRWYKKEFMSTVAGRGAAVIKARGASSAASAANAAIDHVHDWAQGTRKGDWVSMSVPSDGSYGTPEGVIFSFPCVCPGDGTYQIVQGLKLDEEIMAGIKATGDELLAERAVVADLL